MQLADNRSTRRVISLTPLIDVVFILLLFFMLSTQFTRQKAMELSVPVDNGAVVPDEDAPVNLYLSLNGAITIEGTDTVALESLSTHAIIQSAIASATPLQLDADDSVPLQLLVRVTDMLERAGARTVQLMALR